VVVSYALGHGRRPAAAVVAGVTLGDFTAMTCSMLGLGAILAASAFVFTGLRWLGGLYLIYLGFKLWRAPVVTPDAPAPALSLKRIFAHAYAVTALNPKSIIFFIAFVPQFIDTARPFAPQVAILEATFVIMAGLNAALYGWLASKAREKLKNPRVQRAVNRTGGSVLMGAGVLALGWRNS
jgi:threonine/homoserine/homoserine lactone efflux protein